MIGLKSIGGMLLCLSLASTKVFSSEVPIRYVALGDSYTIGTGASPQEAWPSVVTRRLQAQGGSIELTDNLARNGWTSQEVIQQELPALRQLNPGLVTLMIGTNDWVHGIANEVFEAHFSAILDELLQIVRTPNRILIMTIPDFSVSPVGPQYANGRDIAKGLAAYNEIIIRQAQQRQIQVVDLFALSQTMGKDATMFSPDGLHPSAKGYAKWADKIEGALSNLLK